MSTETPTKGNTMTATILPDRLAQCACGCGQDAPLVQRSNARKGHIKGQPMEFISGHNKRGTTNLNRYEVAPDGCWNWTGPLNKKGYGKVQVDGESTSAHRAVWESEHWPLAREVHVDHRCHNTRCVNPAHMRIATALGNNEAKVEPLKVDRSVAVAIREAAGTMTAIAARFGISRQYVADIRNGRRRTALPLKTSALELLAAMIDPDVTA